MLKFYTAGESHGPCLTIIVDGLPSGLKVDVKKIDYDLVRRQMGYGRNKRMSIEHDHAELLGGVIAGETIGAPIAIRIENRDWENWKDRWARGDLEKLTIPRPGHADYAGMLKYNFDDARLVLERASARETAARVAAGALAKILLAEFSIFVGSYVNQIGDVVADLADISQQECWSLAEKSDVRCPNIDDSQRMIAAIENAQQQGDTLGGVFTVSAINLPVGLGSYVHWERRLDSRLAAAVMSIHAVKGVEIGPAFQNAGLPGTQVHDDLFPNEHHGVKRLTNRAGGIEGGMSNGEPLIVHAAMKPIPTTLTPHNSVDLSTGQAARYRYQRSDFCAVPAAAIVGEAMVAWVLADALLEKRGGDSLVEVKR